MPVLTPDNVMKFAGLMPQQKKTPKNLFLSVYGAGGSGKTTVCSKIVEVEGEGPAALFDVDKSSASVVHLQDKGLSIFDINNWREVDAIRREIVKSGGDFQSYIFDNMSEILQLCVKHYAPRGMPEGKEALKLWGLITADMMEFVRDVRNACVKYEKNLFMCLWEELEKDELSGITRIKTLLTPKFGAAFPGMATLVGRTTMHVLRSDRNSMVQLVDFTPDERMDTKFRVAPTEAAVDIPLKLWVKRDSNLVGDMINTIKHGQKFPSAKYERPK